MSTESLEPRITKIEDTMQSLEHTLGEVKSLLTTMSNLLEGTMGQDGLIVKHNDLSLRHFQLEREMNERFSNMERTLIEELNKKADSGDFKAVESKVNRWGGVLSAAIFIIPLVLEFIR